MMYLVRYCGFALFEYFPSVDLLLDILRGYTGNSRKARTLHSPFLFFQSVGNRVCWKAM